MEAAHKFIRQLLSFTNRGGGKHTKSVPLAVLERHYRIHILHNVHKGDTNWDNIRVYHASDEQMGEEAEVEMNLHSNLRNAGLGDCTQHANVHFGIALENLKQETGTMDMEWTREKRQRKRASTDNQDDSFIAMKRERREEPVKQ